MVYFRPEYEWKLDGGEGETRGEGARAMGNVFEEGVRPPPAEAGVGGGRPAAVAGTGQAREKRSCER